ncbi:SH3 domain-containing protein [Rhodanobacter sp. L36]|uniref:C40 family peptidase n=1 Tax=Rhodanobacter sp. L36 TaxID=1747221 RepID=UPI00131C504E|nr:SH3 domain-containing protein [Rhodanobacter sp. L36]
MRLPLIAALLAIGLASNVHARADVSTTAIPPSGVMGVGDAQLTPEYWIGLQPQPDREILSRADIDAENAQLLKIDPSMHDLRALPSTLTRAQVTGWIDDISERPKKALYDVDSRPVTKAAMDAMVTNLALSSVPAQQATRYGLVVQRASLRTFPSNLRVFTSKGDTDIDRFQETAEFPGVPVVIAHASRDGKWLFVVSPRYAAWTEKQNIAEGSAEQVFGYADKKPYRVITGATERTVFTREVPGVSRLQLDMSTRVPLRTDLPPDQPVNGQTPYATYTLELPLRDADGKLQFTPALLQKNTDSAVDYLPLTPANVIRQAFKFLGERYGWGHGYNGRDCSGFVSDVYRSMGVEMPRNTSKQAISPALRHRVFTDADSHDARLKAAHELQVGDLVYIPGHVMMVIGQRDGEPYVIHDVLGMTYRKPGGGFGHVVLNAVSVTPLLPNQFNDHQTYVDRMTSIVRIRH